MPRKALLLKKQASAEETAEEEARRCRVLSKLKLIKTKYAARVLQLSRSALRAMKEINDIEGDMDLEAADVRDDYQDALPDFKLTFEAAYEQQAEEADDTAPRVVDCCDVLMAIEKDAIAAFSSEKAAEAAVAALAPFVDAASK